MVTDKSMTERVNWKIYSCDKCGLTELFDAPSDLFRSIFHNIPNDAEIAAITSKCGARKDGYQVAGKQNLHAK